MIFVDRRKTARNKSVPNRQALLNRIKNSIRNSSPTQIGGSVANVSNNTSTNPVAVTRDVLHEPTFHYSTTKGTFQQVIVGNDRFERGDKIPSNSGGSGKGKGDQAGNSGGGEDDFLVEVSTEEFLKIFFEDCELPNLEETSEKVVPELKPKHAGFTRDGNPASLRVVRSYKQAMPRRKILTAAKQEELDALNGEAAEIQNQIDNETDSDKRSVLVMALDAVVSKIREVERKISSIPFFEKMDLRYAKTEKQMVKSAEAVFIMIMDISGSMDEEKKRMARKFFALQYAFIRQKYPNTDLVFIAHTEEAFEMEEKEFFSTRISGGTVVSTAYELALDIIQKRYDTTVTNLYISQASDGDNYFSDNPMVEEYMTKPNGILSKVRYMSYANLGKQFSASYGDSLKDVMTKIKSGTKKLAVATIHTEDEVFTEFKKIYKKQTTN